MTFCSSFPAPAAQARILSLRYLSLSALANFWHHRRQHQQPMSCANRRRRQAVHRPPAHQPQPVRQPTTKRSGRRTRTGAPDSHVL